MTEFKRHRLAKGMTLARIASRMKVSVAAVHTWESGRSCPSPKYFPKLAAIFGVDAMAITEWFSPRPPVSPFGSSGRRGVPAAPNVVAAVA